MKAGAVTVSILNIRFITTRIIKTDRMKRLKKMLNTSCRLTGWKECSHYKRERCGKENQRISALLLVIADKSVAITHRGDLYIGIMQGK